MNIETTANRAMGWLFLVISLYLFFIGDTVEGLLSIAIGHILFIRADINEYIKGG